MAKAIVPSRAVEAARLRRVARAQKGIAKFEWFVEEVSNKISMTMQQRVRMATQFVKDRVVMNISVPVTKGIGKDGQVVVTERSKPGEFPRADTTQLMKTIMSDVREAWKGVWIGRVGTPLHYGVILETKMYRSFLKRSLVEEKDKITRLLTGPIK